MIIPSHAYSGTATETSAEYIQRYNQIRHLRRNLDVSTNKCHGRVEFSGVLRTDEERELSELDIALLADQGRLCFGGECFRYGNEFRGHYNVD